MKRHNTLTDEERLAVLFEIIARHGSLGSGMSNVKTVFDTTEREQEERENC
ncbi:4-hydroxyphenylpyruvate dioxygenase [Nocardioides sp. YR527]|uniref:hypothetical protein n=1 Tax=Nocardioides sp. YR527 TaxID=1881028 RepID=UPI000880521E|nr:hypothetical protein [Nocardioides sp. YR527]SDK57215.1 4-hydroxyphenylpyruvate dioxygenase [Nocardioides sp. YR527]